eukprot:NODE_8_length_47770_cov_0.334354.p2 type:complete len:1249 gc:universal NODE_8_length_47770_cov_0.334354:13005-16751(+)
MTNKLDRSNMDSLLAELNSDGQGLYELHTHLLGMGNHDFWINEILLDSHKFPRHSDFSSDAVKKRCCPLVWNCKDWHSRDDTSELFDFLAFVETSSQGNYRENAKKPKTNIEEYGDEDFRNEREFYSLKMESDFSLDVVFSIKNLSEALNINSEHYDLLQSQIEEMLGIQNRPGLSKFKRCIIFNARLQKLQIVHGLPLSDLRECIGGNKDPKDHTEAEKTALAHIKNAFSMCNADGSVARSVDFHSFRGSFTPEFYPRRFSLKDSLYEQRLDVLAQLLQWILSRYSNSVPHVKYVEFSIGSSDLSREWVLDVLASVQHEEDVTKDKGFKNVYLGKFSKFMVNNVFDWLRRRKYGVRYKFLAGFNRNKSRVPDGYKHREESFLYECPSIAIGKSLEEINYSKRGSLTVMFSFQETQLKALLEPSCTLKTLNALCTSDPCCETESEVKKALFYFWVVGLDWYGDEKGYPYCAFVTRPFIDFVKSSRRVNPRFGVRVHCGENVPIVMEENPAYRLYISHMYIAFRCLLFLKDELKSHIRVGHGIVFYHMLKDWSFSHKRKSNVLLNEMKVLSMELFKDIPFEINQTSNFYLLPSGAHPYQDMQETFTTFILSTDDDGVWPIDHCKRNHQNHYSLAAEYCNAIFDGIITDSKQLNKHFEVAKKHSFDPDLVDSVTEYDLTLHSDKYSVDYGSNNPKKIKSNSIIIDPHLVYYIFDLQHDDPNDPNEHDIKFHFTNHYNNLYGSNWMNSKIGFDPKSIDIQSIKNIAKVAFTCFYISRFSLDSDFNTEYDFYFGSPPSVDRNKNIEAIYDNLVNVDLNNAGCSIEIATKKEIILFSSELPLNSQGNLSYGNTVFERFLEKKSISQSKSIRIFGFCNKINEKGVSILNELASKYKTSKIEMFTSTEKDKHLTADINPRLNFRHHPDTAPATTLFYVVCMHGSAATAALHYCATESDATVQQLERPSISELVVPFFPPDFKFRMLDADDEDIIKVFLNHYQLHGSEYLTVNESELYDKQVVPVDLLELYDRVMQCDRKSVVECYRSLTTGEKRNTFLKNTFSCFSKFGLYGTEYVELETHIELAPDQLAPDHNAMIPIINLLDRNCTPKRYLVCTTIEKSNISDILNNLYCGSYRMFSRTHMGNNIPLLKILLKECGDTDLRDQIGYEIMVATGCTTWYRERVAEWCDIIELLFSPEDYINRFSEFFKGKVTAGQLAEIFSDKPYKIMNSFQRNEIRVATKGYLKLLKPDLIVQ